MFFLLSFPLPLLSESKSEAIVLHEKGVMAFTDQKYEEALKLFKKSYDIHPADDKNTYYLGIAYLQLDRFSSAEKHLGKLLERNPGYQEAYFEYGFSLYQQGKYKEALPWFERETDHQKQDPLPFLYAGMTHYRLENVPMAIAYLQKVKRVFPQSDAAVTAEEWLAKIERGEKIEAAKAKPAPKRWSLTVAAGSFYDSNVIRDPDREDLAGFANQGGYAATGSVDFKYFLAQREKVKFSTGYSGYQSVYLFDSELDNFNYGRHRANFDWTYAVNDSFQWRVPTNYTFVTLGNAKFVQTMGGEGSLDVAYMNNWLTSLTLGAQRDEFFGTFTNANQNRDATKPFAKIEQYFFAPHNRTLYIKGGYGFEKNLASGDDWDYESHQVSIAMQFPLFWKMKLLLLSEIVAQRSFLHVDSVFNEQRIDRSAISTGIVSKELTPQLNLLGTYSFSIVDSNITRYSYRRQVAGMTLQAKL